MVTWFILINKSLSDWFKSWFSGHFHYINCQLLIPFLTIVKVCNSIIILRLTGCCNNRRHVNNRYNNTKVLGTIIIFMITKILFVMNADRANKAYYVLLAFYPCYARKGGQAAAYISVLFSLSCTLLHSLSLCLDILL